MDEVTVLFLAADPSDIARLRLGQELRDIRENLQRSKQRDTFRLESRESVRPRDITQAIFDVEPQIVHFSGHGTNTGELCFEDILGKTKTIEPNALSSLFELVAEKITCVILNACYSEAQAEAIARHIPFVVGMKQAIGDNAAIAFSVGFYKALGAGRSFKDAYKFACVEIQLEGIPQHLVPVLYIKELVTEQEQRQKFQELEKQEDRGIELEAVEQVKQELDSEREFEQQNYITATDLVSSNEGEVESYSANQEELKPFRFLTRRSFLIACTGAFGLTGTTIFIQFVKEQNRIRNGYVIPDSDNPLKGTYTKEMTFTITDSSGKDKSYTITRPRMVRESEKDVWRLAPETDKLVEAVLETSNL